MINFRDKFTIACLMAALTTGRRDRGAKFGSRAQRAQFIRYAASQNKHYETNEEFGRRMGNWLKNHALVEQMNETFEDEDLTFADNFTSDLSDEEFATMMGSPDRLGSAFEAEEGQPSGHGRDLQEVSYINWIDSGKVHPVKNQGYCGSCWAFAALLVQESMEAIKSDSAPVRLSD